MSYSDYARQIYPRLFEQRWVESTLNGQRIGAITMNRSYRHDVWMCPWFSQLRSAYGLFLWGRTLHEPDWTARALATRDLHLAAPQSRGLFPTVFVFGNTPDSHRWVHSHHQGGGNNIYHLFDMSWTVYQLLRWHTDILPHAPSVEFARRYAHGLMALQAPAGSPMPGSLPAYVDATTLAPMAHVDHAALRADLAAHPGGDGYVAWGLKDAWSQERFTNSAEDSASLLCLAALVATLRPDDPDRPRFLAAAKNIASFLEHHIFPTACWKDFEVYYSCAPKPLDFYDHRSGQHPINTLCLHMAAAGLLALHQITGEPHHLDLAHQALAKLSLFQQVWDSPNLNFHGFGGYGCMNTDGEWNDARQGQFADTHLDFYLATRSAEQLQRAQAACRAAFATLFHPANTAIYPTGWNRTPIGQAAENHGHGGSDGLNGVSSFDWGSGSALATAAYYHHKLGPQ